MIAHANERSAKAARFNLFVVTPQPFKTMLGSTDCIRALAVCFSRILSLRFAIKAVIERGWFGAVDVLAVTPGQPLDGHCRARDCTLSSRSTSARPESARAFCFCHQDYVTGILAQAGFTEIHFESVQRSVLMAPSVDEAIAFQMDIGPAARALRSMDESTRAEALAAIHGALAPYLTDAGVEMLVPFG